MAASGSTAPPVVDPPSGYLPGRRCAGRARHPGAARRRRRSRRAHRAVADARRRAPVVLTDTDAGHRRARPELAVAALAVRQRLLSDAALHALSDATATSRWWCPLPPYWNPGSAWSAGRLLRRARPALAAAGRPALGGAAPRPTPGDGRAGLPRGRAARPSCRWPTCWPPALISDRCDVRPAAARQRHRRRRAGPDRAARLLGTSAAEPPGPRRSPGRHARPTSRRRCSRSGSRARLRDDVQRDRADPGHPGQRPRPVGDGRHHRPRPAAPGLTDRHAEPVDPRPRPAHRDPAPRPPRTTSACTR